MNKLFVMLITLFICTTVIASDLAKEKRWADQVVDTLMDGDALWLKTTDPKQPEFLGILTEASEDKHKAAIIMHGMGVHPDWQQVIQPIRVGLTEHDWNTLSIQMPILSNEAKLEEYSPLFEEVAPRIQAAIKHLKGTGNERIILIAHSLGTAMGAYFLTNPNQDISGFVAIGMDATVKDKRMNEVHSLKQITIPILDLYGSDDLNAVKTAKERASSAKQAGNKHYTQIVDKDANHFYDGKDSELVTTIATWLNQIK